MLGNYQRNSTKTKIDLQERNCFSYASPNSYNQERDRLQQHIIPKEIHTVLVEYMGRTG
jgi:hypothetical protein